MVIAYTGLPGGGKSLSALQDYLLPELMRGRHVFCNIDGLRPVMVAYKLSAPDKPVTTSYVSRYLHRFSMSFSDDRADERKVWREDLPDGSVYYANAEGLSLLVGEVLSPRYNVPGSEPVVIVDECHEYLSAMNWKLLRPFLKYVSFARHEGHDLIFITQHITDIWDSLQKRVHETHDFVRGRLGIRTRYVERVYHGCNILRDPAYSKHRKNDKSLYGLYSSHSGGAGEHLGYVSIWRNRRLWLLICVFFLLVFLAVFNLPRLFSYFGSPASPPAAASLPPPDAPVISSNVLYVKYVVCGSFDCQAARPDGSFVTLPLDYASGKYPLEVRKYVPQNNDSYRGSFSSGFPSARPGLPDAAGRGGH